ncbi:MAG: hypothetical protein R8K50_04125 [Mariprofundus sp.]
MKLKIWMVAITLLAAGPAWACDAAGPDIHVGQVSSVNGNSFTITDAQSGGPISFTTAGDMHGKAPKQGDAVSVKYSKGEKGLVAESVH